MENKIDDKYIDGYNDACELEVNSTPTQDAISMHYLTEMSNNKNVSDYSVGFVCRSLLYSHETNNLSKENYDRIMKNVVNPHLSKIDQAKEDEITRYGELQVESVKKRSIDNDPDIAQKQSQQIQQSDQISKKKDISGDKRNDLSM
ncbi:MAG: hypothetical protein RLO81_09660 [Fulvivirga sp.]|uniref:hypothetical protein n=1 Tax=Fulvivirga sp. TaxID=1931237 RepID=UPI0032EC85CF